MIRLTLYGKPDCSLCDKMKSVVDRVSKQVAIDLQVVSIEDDPGLWELYWKDIPVLVRDGGILFRHRVTETALLGAVRES